MSLAVFGRKKGTFGLDYSFHTRLFQVSANSTGRERLICDIDKCFGSLDSIFSLSRDNKILSMSNVGRRKL